jgi:hypothetical protein
MKKLATLAAVFVSLGLLAVAPSALADSSSHHGYGDDGDRTQIDINVDANANANAQANANAEARGGAPAQGVAGERASNQPEQHVAGARAASPARGGAPSVSRGSLPFTGLDLSFVVGGGLILLGMGVALRQATRRTSPADPV